MSSSSVAAGAPARAALHRVFRRVHFWAGLVGAPTAWLASGATEAQPLDPARELASSEIKTLERVNVTASRPASMPIEIPTTLESRPLPAERCACPPWTTEWTAERDLTSLGLAGSLRTTLFQERTKDALYSQINVTVTPNVINIQNIAAVHTTGVEAALDNSDPNGLTYTSVASFWVVDVRVQYRVAKQWKLSAGVDNLNNQKYWAFHPYPQRTFNADLRFDH